MPPVNARKILDPAARAHRVRYAMRTILRDGIANEAAFRNSLEMEDAEEVIDTILRRGLKNPKLRAALRSSHLINLNQWLAGRPALAGGYDAMDEENTTKPDYSKSAKRRG
jgi:hypothetical protein